MSAHNDQSLSDSAERTVSETTYQHDYSNSEPLGSHVVFETTTALPFNQQLKSYSNTTAEQAKPIETMPAIYTNGTQRQPSALEQQKISLYLFPMEKTKMMSENERLDDQLRNGTDYVNLPAHLYPTDRAPTWIPQQSTANDQQNKPRQLRFLHHGRPSTSGSQLFRSHFASHQQMDAQNRLQQLEVIRPTENINLLNVKFRTLQHPRHARPILPQYRDDYVNTLYDQAGAYIQERSGLYHTENYEPNSLVRAIPELENQQGNSSLAGDEHNPDELLDQAEQGQNREKSKLFQTRAIGDYENMRNRLVNKFRVAQNTGTVDGRTQEGNKQFVQRESTYGQAYNTPKFLQSNTLSHNARYDPTRLMSTRYNTNLDRIRNLSSYPTKAASDQATSSSNNTDTLVSPILHPTSSDELYGTKYISERTDGYSHRSTARVYDSPFQPKYDSRSLDQFSQQQTAHSQSNSFDEFLSIPTPLPRAVKTAIRLPGPEIVARFIEPNVAPPTTQQRSYKGISYHETSPQLHTSIRDRKQSSDNLLSQWKLRDIQDRWSKTQAQQQYHLEHPETVPDVGGSTIRAKKEIMIADAIAKRGMLAVR